MAKYDDIYPDAQEDFVSNKHDKLPPVVKFGPMGEDEESHKCACGALTDWVNPTATQFVCSTECNIKIWNQLLGVFVAQQLTGMF